MNNFIKHALATIIILVSFFTMLYVVYDFNIFNASAYPNLKGFIFEVVIYQIVAFGIVFGLHKLITKS